MDTEPDIKDSKDSIILEKVEGRVEFIDVSFKYGEGGQVLKDINLNLEPGGDSSSCRTLRRWKVNTLQPYTKIL